MCGGDYYYPGVQLIAWKVTEDKLHYRCYPGNFLKLLTTLALPFEQL